MPNYNLHKWMQFPSFWFGSKMRAGPTWLNRRESWKKENQPGFYFLQTPPHTRIATMAYMEFFLKMALLLQRYLLSAFSRLSESFARFWIPIACSVLSWAHSQNRNCLHVPVSYRQEVVTCNCLHTLHSFCDECSTVCYHAAIDTSHPVQPR